MNKSRIVSEGNGNICVAVKGLKFDLSNGWVKCERQYDFRRNAENPLSREEARAKALTIFRNSYN